MGSAVDTSNLTAGCHLDIVAVAPLLGDQSKYPRGFLVTGQIAGTFGCWRYIYAVEPLSIDLQHSNSMPSCYNNLRTYSSGLQFYVHSPLPPAALRLAARSFVNYSFVS